jgi:hypothetical protein
MCFVTLVEVAWLLGCIARTRLLSVLSVAAAGMNPLRACVVPGTVVPVPVHGVETRLGMIGLPTDRHANTVSGQPITFQAN